MTTVYRCVTQNGVDGIVMAIGLDEKQGGINYNDVGIWCLFTFEEIPQPNGDVLDLISENRYMNSVLKVVDNQVVVRTLEEIQTELNPPSPPQEPQTPQEPTP